MSMRRTATVSLIVLMITGALSLSGISSVSLASRSGLNGHVTEPSPVNPRPASGLSAPTKPPFGGTVWVTPHVLNADCSTDFTRLTYVGQEYRQTWDARVDQWVTNLSHIYRAEFAPGRPTVDMVVNPEFSQEAGAMEAERLARLIGRAPPMMRTNLDEAWIHAGRGLASANVGSVLFPTGFYGEAGGFIEEVLLHELAHVEFDPVLGGRIKMAEWQEAQKLDGRFISDYAQSFPMREDIAESYGAYAVWVAAQSNKSLTAVAAQIESTIPHRLRLIQQLGPEFAPATASCTARVDGSPVAPKLVSASTNGKITTISWHRADDPRSLTHYRWRVGRTGLELGAWRQFGTAYSTRLQVRNTSRGVNWTLEIRACKNEACGPVAQVLYRS